VSDVLKYLTRQNYKEIEPTGIVLEWSLEEGNVMECLLFISFIRYATTDKNEELIAEDKKTKNL